MEKVMRTWGIAIIALFMLVFGVIGSLIFDPSLPFILGLVTGAILIALLNLIYVRFFKYNQNETKQDE